MVTAGSLTAQEAAGCDCDESHELGVKFLGDWLLYTTLRIF